MTCGIDLCRVWSKAQKLRKTRRSSWSNYHLLNTLGYNDTDTHVWHFFPFEPHNKPLNMENWKRCYFPKEWFSKISVISRLRRGNSREHKYDNELDLKIWWRGNKKYFFVPKNTTAALPKRLFVFFFGKKYPTYANFWASRLSYSELEK